MSRRNEWKRHQNRAAKAAGTAAPRGVFVVEGAGGQFKVDSSYSPEDTITLLETMLTTMKMRHPPKKKLFLGGYDYLGPSESDQP